uniref:Tetratricopeptide repeat domain 3 n=2 Tax=Mus musculus TaxID=10090 RepID=E9QAH3_MOUSE
MPGHRGAPHLPPWVCGLCSMDDFAEGGLSLADDILLEDYPYEDDCICTPDFTTDDYVRVTQLYYEGVNMTSAISGAVSHSPSCKITVMPLSCTSSGHFFFNINTVL